MFILLAEQVVIDHLVHIIQVTHSTTIDQGINLASKELDRCQCIDSGISKDINTQRALDGWEGMATVTVVDLNLDIVGIATGVCVTLSLQRRCRRSLLKANMMLM